MNETSRRAAVLLDRLGRSTTGDTVETSSATETLETIETPGCPQCGSPTPWGAASWCPDCGYYPALGSAARPAQSEQSARTPAAETAADEKLWQIVPAWVWLLSGGVLVVLSASVAARLSLRADSPYRVLWTLLQVLVGLIVGGTAHVLAYFVAVRRSDRFGPFDLFLRPIEIWRPSLAQLPASSRRLCLAVWGLTAAIAAIAIVGGLDYNALFKEDWATPRAQKNLVHEIVEKARKDREGEGSLEDAMNQFVGEAQPQDELSIDDLPQTDCLIVGYVPDEAKVFKRILLAAVPPGGKLSFVASITADEVPAEAFATLRRRMPDLRQKEPFVESPYPAVWLRPRLMCRIAHTKWSAIDRLEKPQFVKLLEDVETE
ncbi:MAG: hypothetical protein KY476_08785 [Planctomycetes bacterium]|nr:hypothetical protein [Planctomycetota bacterium]